MSRVEIRRRSRELQRELMDSLKFPGTVELKLSPSELILLQQTCVQIELLGEIGASMAVIAWPSQATLPPFPSIWTAIASRAACSTVSPAAKRST